MAFSLAAAIVVDVPDVGVDLLTSSTGISMMFIEIAVGLAAGLTLTIWFAAVLLAGEKIASSAGLGYAAQVDPATGGQTPVVSQILYLFLLVVFLSVDGHLLAIGTMMESYRILPVGAPVAPELLIASGITAAGSMFLAATIIMLPITTVLLMINVAIGIITRSAPQLNLFSFGFPISLLAVFLLLFFSASALGASSQSLIDSALTSLRDLIGGLPVAEENQDGRKRPRNPPSGGFKKPPKKGVF